MITVQVTPAGSRTIEELAEQHPNIARLLESNTAAGEQLREKQAHESAARILTLHRVYAGGRRRARR